MIHAVLVSREKQKFEELEQVLWANHIDILTWTGTGKNALALLPDDTGCRHTIDLLIVDETLDDMEGRELVEKVVTQSPMTNCAAASSLSAKAFHDSYEGLGVLMQLPLVPTWQDGEALIACLEKCMVPRG